MDSDVLPYRRIDADRLTTVEANYKEIMRAIEDLKGAMSEFFESQAECDTRYRQALKEAVEERVKVTDGLKKDISDVGGRVGKLELFWERLKGIRMGISWVTVGASTACSVIGTAVTIWALFNYRVL